MTDSFKEVVGLWPSARELAEELKVEHEAVRGWSRNNSIPAKCWLDIIEAPRARRAKITLRRLAEFAALRK